MALTVTAAGPELDLESFPSLTRTGHQFTNNNASGNARQHIGDTYVSHTVNYIIVADSGIDVIERGTASPERIASLQERLAPTGLTVKEDTASMIVHRDDNASIRDSYTDTRSRLSLSFVFDRELFGTNVYGEQFRSLVKRDIRSRKKEPKGLKDRTMDRKSSATENLAANQASLTALLQEYHIAPKTSGDQTVEQSSNIAGGLQPSLCENHSEAHALLIGNSDDDRAAVMIQLHGLDLRYDCPNSRSRYRPLVYKDLIHHTKLLIKFAFEFNIKLDDRIDQTHLVDVLDYNVPKYSYGTLDRDIAKTVVALWNVPALLAAVTTASHRLPTSTLCLIDEVARLAAGDYVPTEADFTRIQVRDVFTTICHVDSTNYRLSFRLTNVGCQKCSPKSSIPSLVASSPTAVVILCVNLAKYDQGAEANELLQSIEYVQSISHLRTMTGRRLPIILLLTHEKDFREKLATIPLARCFPKYGGGPDFEQATKYVIKRFRTVVHGQHFYPRVTGVNFEEDVEFLLASIKAARAPLDMSRALAESGFL